MSYRILENNGLYKIEKFKRVGMLWWARYEWVQLYKLNGYNEVMYDQPLFYHSREKVEEVFEKVIKQHLREVSEWKVIKTHP